MSQSLPSALKLLGASLLLNLLALPLYFVPLLNLPVWLAVNGYLVGARICRARGRTAPAAAFGHPPAARQPTDVLAGRCA